MIMKSAFGMLLIRILFVLGMVLVVVHRLILAVTPAWFDIFVAVYLFLVLATVALIALFRKNKLNAEAKVDEPEH
jgi:hypothetical protein